MAVVRFPVKGSTLQMAREMLYISREELGRAAGLAAERIATIEAGEAQPTHKQMRKIAKKLDRPLAYFLAPAPTETDVPETIDFRGGSHAEIPSALARDLKRAASYREAFLSLSDDIPELRVPPRVTRENVKESAHQFRTLLGIMDDFRPTESQANAVFNFWRGQLETAGYLVFQTTGVPLSAFRGLSVHAERMPIILLNGADAANGKVFTLFHEVAHIANRTSGLCNLNDDDQEEAICNAFAAEVLMPISAVETFLLGQEQPNPERLAQHFRVSVSAAAVRLRTLDRMTQDELDDIRKQENTKWQEYRDSLRSREGGPPHWRTKYRDLGPHYLGAIFNAAERGRLSELDVTYLLDSRLPTVQKLQEEYFRTGGE